MKACPDAVLAARALLAEVTPLRADCGRVCGAACCESLEGEETGMLLFPGEEALYRELPGFTLRRAALGWLLVCSGRCLRSQRPLSCRLFPLLPGGDGTVMDLRAAAVCPLARQGMEAFAPAFTEAVAAAGKLLRQDAAQRAFLERLQAEQDEWRRLCGAFRAGL